jgi:hypothetical protein
LKQQIESSDLVLCDLTFDNANVFYELGVSHTLGKPTLLISQTASSIPFNVAQIEQPQLAVLIRFGKGSACSTPEFIRYAVRYLGENRDAGSYSRIRQIAQTSYSLPDLVRDALDALWSINGPGALETILDAAREHWSYLVRERAVLLLANYGPGEKVEPAFKYQAKILLEAAQERLSEDSWGVRRSLCEVLGR